MEFLFRLSNYDDPALETETAELLCQRLEARSRRVMPRMWRVTDRLNAHQADASAAAHRRKRYRLYGVLLLALGVFVLVPGLMEPGSPKLIFAGAFAILSGAAEFCLAGVKKPLAPPAPCRKEAAELLKLRRESDWEALRAEVRFDEAGWSVHTAEDSSRTAYDQLWGVFETERLWLLAYEKNMALLLQKKDLISGEAGEFAPCLRGKIIQ